MPRFVSVVLSSLFVISAIPSLGQVPDPLVAAQAPQPGSEHSYIGMGAETVNPADGQVSFDLPIHTPAGRQLSFPFGIRYSTAEDWHLAIPGGSVSGTFQWAPQPNAGNVTYGWSYDLPYLTGKTLAQQMWYTTINGNPPQFVQHQCDAASDFIFRGFDGRQYILNLAGGDWNDAAYTGTNSTDCVDNYPYNAVTTSNRHGVLATYPSTYTGWPLYPPVTVVDQSGTTYQFSGGWGPGYSAISPNSPAPGLAMAQTITDRNGNQISANGNSYKDTLSRTVVSWTPLTNNPSQITVSGLPSNIVVRWSPAAIGGANYPMSGHRFSGTATCTVPTTGPPIGNYGITEIDLPNGQSYKLAYNSTYGTISQIEFPDGGSVSYNWNLKPSYGLAYGQWWFNDGNGYQAQESCTVVYDVPVITDRWVNDGTRNVLHQVFSYCRDVVTGSCPPYIETTAQATTW